MLLENSALSIEVANQWQTHFSPIFEMEPGIRGFYNGFAPISGGFRGTGGGGVWQDFRRIDRKFMRSTGWRLKMEMQIIETTAGIMLNAFHATQRNVCTVGLHRLCRTPTYKLTVSSWMGHKMVDLCSTALPFFELFFQNISFLVLVSSK